MKSILVADDSRTTRLAVSDLLRKNNYNILEAANGYQVLETINKNQIDLIVLDLLMPEMDGFQVLETIQEKNLKTPVIVLSADIQESTKEKCLNLGARVFLNKPLKPLSSLLDIINGVFNSK